MRAALRRRRIPKQPINFFPQPQMRAYATKSLRLKRLVADVLQSDEYIHLTARDAGGEFINGPVEMVPSGTGWNILNVRPWPELTQLVDAVRAKLRPCGIVRPGMRDTTIEPAELRLIFDRMVNQPMHCDFNPVQMERAERAGELVPWSVLVPLHERRFKLGDRTLRLKPGAVLAYRGDTPHAGCVTTRDPLGSVALQFDVWPAQTSMTLSSEQLYGCDPEPVRLHTEIAR